jgi:acyl-CoA dehydrogenase
MDTQGNAAARSEVAAIKVVAMEVAHDVVNRAVQTFGAAGVSDDTVLARLWAITRALQIADGPNEVHLRTIGNLELAGYRKPADPARHRP